MCSQTLFPWPQVARQGLDTWPKMGFGEQRTSQPCLVVKHWMWQLRVLIDYGPQNVEDVSRETDEPPSREV